MKVFSLCCPFWFCVPQITFGQVAELSLKDGSNLSTELKFTFEKKLFTKSGSFLFSEISSVRYASEEDSKKKSSITNDLLLGDVIVYVRNVRLYVIQESLHADSTLLSNNPKIQKEISDPFTLGVGFGPGYGGAGGRLSMDLTRKFDFLLAAGYNGVDAGLAIGGRYKFFSNKLFTPIASIFYGCNSTIKIPQAPNLNSAFYGFLLGFGYQWKSKNSGITMQGEIVMPLRTEKFNNYFSDSTFDKVKSSPVLLNLGVQLPLVRIQKEP